MHSHHFQVINNAWKHLKKTKRHLLSKPQLVIMLLQEKNRIILLMHQESPPDEKCLFTIKLNFAGAQR